MIKLNNKGQTLIMFILLIPLILVIMALVIDTSFVYKEKIKFQSVTKTIMKTTYENKDTTDFNNKTINLYKKNGIDTNNIVIKVNSDSIVIKNQTKVKSIFGNIIGIKNYKVKFLYKIYKENESIKVIKE